MEEAGIESGEPGGTRPEGSRLPPPPESLRRLAAPVTALSGIGPAYGKRLSQLGIGTVGELLYHFPRRYLDRSTVTPIGSVKTAEEVTVVGRVQDVESRATRSRKRLLVVTIFDGTGYMSGVWFNQDYHKERLPVGTEVSFSGKVRYQYNRLQIVNPSYDVLGSANEDSGTGSIHTGRIIPVYPETAGVSSAALRKFISRALDAIEGMADPLPPDVRRKFGLVELVEALRQVHFPENGDSLKKARYRALFEEIFVMQVGLALIKKHREQQGRGIVHVEPGEKVKGFMSSLPFELTRAQRNAWGDIAGDMRSKVQMNRLLQGEVGSGKTVVAVLALLLATEGGYQGAIMAPTEVLAHQHYRRISEMLEGVPVKVALVSGRPEPALLDQIARGDVDIVVGTHALIQEHLEFDRLGIAVVDEQHRFGLRQRVVLAKKGRVPDLLHMSATPIPRTLAMTLYGDLDVSVIDELPAGRKGVVTVVADKSQRRGTYAMVDKEISLGRQVFVICPLIEKSDKLEARAAEQERKRLSGQFPSARIALLHGQMKSELKKETMERFSRGEIDILISTVLVEVGIDVPNATVMIVENADRFGLAQLHQLRGRIGRGTERGVLILFADPSTEEARARMEAIQRYEDGFSLAEADMEIRGEGSIFGTRQSGFADLKLARLSRNYRLIREARKEAFALVDGDRRLSGEENRLLRWEVNRRFGGTLGWLFHG